MLATELTKLKLDPGQSIIAAIPRGGVIIGQIIAQKLEIPLTAVVIKKLGAPFNPELAIGATASFGKPVLDHWLIADLAVPKNYLRREIRKKRREAADRETFLGLRFGKDQFQDKNVVVVDDGIATGQTVRAAARVVKEFEAKKLILAIPCASPSALELVSKEYDKVITLEVSEDLVAVGQFYEDFRPIEDREVKEILATSQTITSMSKKI